VVTAHRVMGHVGEHRQLIRFKAVLKIPLGRG
jgi:hypothetical protein